MKKGWENIFNQFVPSKWKKNHECSNIKRVNWARVITPINNFIGLQVNDFPRISLLFILPSNIIFIIIFQYIQHTYIRTPVSKTNQI